MSDTIGQRLAKLRKLMAERNLDVYVVRSTDKYLLEYIPAEENERIFFSGFTGSTGDMIVSRDQAFLFVDGRYHTQADIEIDETLINVIKVPLGTSIEASLRTQLMTLIENQPHTLRIGYNSQKWSRLTLRQLKESLKKQNYKMVDLLNKFMEPFDLKPTMNADYAFSQVPNSVSGLSVNDKLKRIRQWMLEHHYSFLLICQLEDIAYLCNLRSFQLPNNSSFKSMALICETAAYLFLTDNRDLSRVQSLLEPEFSCFHEREMADLISKIIDQKTDINIKLAFDEVKTSNYRYKMLRNSFPRLSLESIDSPITQMKCIKTKEELNYMTQSFRKADYVVKHVIQWVNRKISHGDLLSERNVADKVKSSFLAINARDLSFSVISACGSNSAIVHYSKADPEKLLKNADLMLIDTGAYFDCGYATDLTRTFLVGGKLATPSHKQKEIYSVVLKSAIRLMKARFPRGAKAVQLDAIVRSTLWQYGYVYNHGTGHGVGISVHESPPRLGESSQDIIEENMVFSIEPGIYLENFGGVRIENIVTVEPDPDFDGWLKIKPLTFAPLDENLIDEKYLSDDELDWLKSYMKRCDDYLKAMDLGL